MQRTAETTTETETDGVVERDRERLSQCRADQAAPQRSGHHRQVVVLDQHHVPQPGAMIGAAARTHRSLLERAPAGRGLTRIEDACAGSCSGGIDEATRERSDAGETLQEVQSHALSREYRTGGTVHPHDRFSRAYAFAVAGDHLDLAARLQPQEHGSGERSARDHAIRLRYDRGMTAGARRDGPARRPVTGTTVFLEREIDEVQCGFVDCQLLRQSRRHRPGARHVPSTRV